MAEDSFLRRWSRLKAETRDAPAPAPGSRPLEVPLARSAFPPRGTATHALDASVHAADATAPALDTTAPGLGDAPGTERSPAPSLADVARLTTDSDYSAFVARSIDPAVRRGALRKLFADPHFHCIDGLDVYMGDYTQPSPMSEAMLAALDHARKLFRPEPDPGAHDQSPALVQLSVHVPPDAEPLPPADPSAAPAAPAAAAAPAAVTTPALPDNPPAPPAAPTDLLAATPTPAITA